MSEVSGSYGRKMPVSVPVSNIDYKELRLLRRCTTENGKIIPARMIGFSRIQQRRLKKAIENARFLAFLPYVVE